MTNLEKMLDITRNISQRRAPRNLIFSSKGKSDPFFVMVNWSQQLKGDILNVISTSKKGSIEYGLGIVTYSLWVDLVNSDERFSPISSFFNEAINVTCSPPLRNSSSPIRAKKLNEMLKDFAKVPVESNYPSEILVKELITIIDEGNLSLKNGVGLFTCPITGQTSDLSESSAVENIMAYRYFAFGSRLLSSYFRYPREISSENKDFLINCFKYAQKLTYHNDLKESCASYERFSLEAIDRCNSISRFISD